MPGLLTHLITAFVGGVIIYLFSRKYLYSGFWVLGTLIPDTIKFGIPAIRLKTASFAVMMTDPLYATLNSFTHSIWFWLVISGIVFLVGYLFGKYEKWSWKKVRVIFISNIIFLASIVVHLIMDVFIIESSYWI